MSADDIAGARVPEQVRRTPWDDGRGALVLGQLLEQLDQLPAQRPVASRMVQMTHDESMSSARLAAVAQADSALTARLMRLANSAYYGLSGRVRTVTFAVTVVGFTTVRSLALSAAAGVDGTAAVPPTFWARSAATAVAAGELARRFSLPAPDTFCLGLLSGIGQALLYSADEAAYSALLAGTTDRRELTAAERARYGASHVSVSAAALETWNLPREMAASLRAFDRWPLGLPGDSGDLTTGCLLVADEVADRIVHPHGSRRDVRHMSTGRIGEDDVAALARRVPALADDLVRAVTG